MRKDTSINRFVADATALIARAKADSPGGLVKAGVLAVRVAEATQAVYDDARAEGHADGFKAGKDAGYLAGAEHARIEQHCAARAEGYAAGREAGYAAGYAAGRASVTGEREPGARIGRDERVALMIEAACAAAGVSVEDFMSRSRNPAAVAARRAVVVAAKANTRLSYPELARMMNRPNHSTIISHIKDARRALGERVGHKSRTVVCNGSVRDLGAIVQATVEAGRRVEAA